MSFELQTLNFNSFLPLRSHTNIWGYEKVKRSKAMFRNLVILTAATVFMRFVALSFNVYVSNTLGAYGAGVYALITSVGGFALTLAMSGINLAATRMVAGAIGRGSDAAVRQAMKRCMIYALCFGSAAAAGLAALAGPISTRILHDAECILPLRIMSVSLPCISLSSAMYGYFTAERRVIKSSSAQIFEQFVRIGATVSLVSLFMPKDAEHACAAVVAGGAISEIGSFVFCFVMYRRDLAKHVSRRGKTDPHVTKELLGISLPVAFTTYVRSGLVTVEHILIPRGLKKSGASYQTALASYGVLHGMVFPVILFPMTVMSAFAGLLVPEISECQARGEDERIGRIASRVIQSSLTFSCGVAGIMLCFSGTLGNALYSNAEAGEMIRVMAPLIPVMYLDHVIDGMLKGLGEQLYSMKVNVADAFISTVLVYFIIPHHGVYGYVFIVILMEIVNASLSAARLFSRVPVRIMIGKWLIKPLICIAGAVAAVSVLMKTAFAGIDPAAGAAISVGLSALIYPALLRLSGGVTHDDIVWFKSSIG